MSRTASTSPPDAATSWFFDAVRETALDEGVPEGRVTLVERRARAGQMPPLSRRDEDECYRVVQGRVTFFVGDVPVPASDGDVIVVPAAEARTFRAETDDARWLVLTRVRAQDRFEDFGRAVGAPVPEPGMAGWLCSDEASTVASIARPNGIEILGPPGALPR